MIDRLRQHWRFKLWLGAALSAFFCAGYFTAQRLPIRGATTLPLSWLDRQVPFSPAWAWGYQSFYLMLPVAWLATTRRQLWRYAAGFALLSIIGFACFLAWPVRGPRPAEAPATGMFGLLASYDRPLNSFPSLHVALAVYSALFAFRMWRSKLLLAALSLWTLLIAYATLATKQHYAVDLLPGAALAGACDWLAWRKGETS